MNALALLRSFGPADLRNVRRDPVLLWALVLPVFVALLLRWGLPAVTVWLQTRLAFDFVPYYPLIAGAYFLVAPGAIGFIGGFLLLDERDDRVLDAILVTPVSIKSLVTYRLLLPLVIGSLITTVGYAVLDVVPLPTTTLIAATALGACSGPILALLLTGFAENKVSGFALAKLFSAVSNFALVAWFVPMPWQFAAGLVPSYWPMKLVWQTADGGPWFGYAIVGLAVNALVLAVLLRRVRRVLSR